MPCSSPIENLISVLLPIHQSKHLMANRLYQVAFQTAKTYLLSFDVSFEIAKYLHSNGVVDHLDIVLSLNLDKERLEREMRLFFVARKLDKCERSDESALLQSTTRFFGPKFNQKQDLILKEHPQQSEKVDLTIMPSLCWPIQLSNPLKKSQIIHPLIL